MTPGTSAAPALVLAALASAMPLAAQLPGASPAALGTANNSTALVRGYGAIGANPANLGMPDRPAYSLSIMPTQLRGGLGPVGFRQIKPFENGYIPDARKELWMQEIEAAGGQSGGGAMFVTPLAMSFRRFGLQLSTVAVAEARLNPAAAELMLFGNAGRTGTGRDFNLEGSSLHGFAITTAALSFAIPLEFVSGPEDRGHFAVGATVKYSVGNALLVGRDGGSVLESDPVSGSVRFPILQSDSVLDGKRLDKGAGVGLDAGVSWRGRRLTLGAAVQNVIHTFGWDESQFFVRSGEALFGGGAYDSDFGLSPASDAPGPLVEEMRRMKFRPSATVGAAYDASRSLTVTGDIRRRFGDGILLGPRSHVGIGVEYLPAPFLPLRAGTAFITRGAQLGAGAGLALGPLELLGSALLRTVDGRSETLLAAGLSLDLR